MTDSRYSGPRYADDPDPAACPHYTELVKWRGHGNSVYLQKKPIGEPWITSFRLQFDLHLPSHPMVILDLRFSRPHHTVPTRLERCRCRASIAPKQPNHNNRARLDGLTRDNSTIRSSKVQHELKSFSDLLKLAKPEIRIDEISTQAPKTFLDGNFHLDPMWLGDTQPLQFTDLKTTT